MEQAALLLLEPEYLLAPTGPALKNFPATAERGHGGTRPRGTRTTSDMLTLYHDHNAVCCQEVELALAEKRLSFRE